MSLADGSVPSVSIPGSVALDAVTLYLGLCGDVNGDGIVNVDDGVIMLQIVVGLYQTEAIQTVLADLDGTGRVEVVDVITVLEYIVGFIPAPRRVEHPRVNPLL